VEELSTHCTWSSSPPTAQKMDSNQKQFVLKF